MIKFLNNVNKAGSKISKVTKKISDINAIAQITQGNTRSVKRKAKNKVKNALWRKIIK